MRRLKALLHNKITLLAKEQGPKSRRLILEQIGMISSEMDEINKAKFEGNRVRARLNWDLNFNFTDCVLHFYPIRSQIPIPLYFSICKLFFFSFKRCDDPILPNVSFITHCKMIFLEIFLELCSTGYFNVVNFPWTCCVIRAPNDFGCHWMNPNFIFNGVLFFFFPE